MIPNYAWKCLSGWSNNSCKVKTQKMTEKEMGDRGTKSGTPSVKAQRVDGSWWTQVHLRCTLMASERRYQTRHPAKRGTSQHPHNYQKLSPGRLGGVRRDRWGTRRQKLATMKDVIHWGRQKGPGNSKTTRKLSHQQMSAWNSAIWSRNC